MSSKPILDELDQLRVSNTGDNVGNLEPPIEVLELLLNSDLIRDDVRSVLDSGPLQELLDFKLEKLKPPPPTPPPPPPEEIPPSRIITIPSSRSRKGKNKSAASGSTSKTSPSQAKKLSEGSPSSLKITVPRATRQSIAAAAAFEAEAEQPPVAVDESAAPVSSKKRKRATSPLPSPDPSAGNEMSARETFKRFDVGWVLPEGHKRGGRKGRDETPTIPPPRKRVRTTEPSMCSLLPWKNKAKRITKAIFDPLSWHRTLLTSQKLKNRPRQIQLLEVRRKWKCSMTNRLWKTSSRIPGLFQSPTTILYREIIPPQSQMWLLRQAK